MQKLPLTLLVLLACASPSEGLVSLDTGLETDVLGREPRVDSLVVEAIDTSGNATEIARRRLPADVVDLGELPKVDTASLRVRGLDAQGAERVRGESLYAAYGDLERATLRIFLQRTGESARFPSPFSTPYPSSDRVDVIAGRYVAVADGARLVAYDVANLAPIADRTLPVEPKTVAAFDTRLLLVSDAAQAVVVDLATRDETKLDAPPGGSFAEVAGGRVVRAGAQGTYVVGATRTSNPTAKVLRVAKDGALSFVELSSARAGAGASWVEGARPRGRRREPIGRRGRGRRGRLVPWGPARLPPRRHGRARGSAARRLVRRRGGWAFAACRRPRVRGELCPTDHPVR
ncbi:MAG: hypothetical protein IPK71_20100 [Myxococcales bacterium]|nr:hypothetical protein [Myxococcales bacterium]